MSAIGKARKAGADEGLGALVDAWLAYAIQVADFPGDLDDYLLGLEVRSDLQRAMGGVAREDAVRLGKAVAVGDSRYRRRTVTDDAGLLRPHTTWDRSEWWWKRVPAHGPVLRWLQDGEARSIIVPGRG